MSQKDYIALAAAFKREKPAKTVHEDRYIQWTRDVLSVSAVLAGDNFKFKKDVFLRACDFEIETY